MLDLYQVSHLRFAFIFSLDGSRFSEKISTKTAHAHDLGRAYYFICIQWYKGIVWSALTLWTPILTTSIYTSSLVWHQEEINLKEPPFWLSKVCPMRLFATLTCLWFKKSMYLSFSDISHLHQNLRCIANLPSSFHDPPLLQLGLVSVENTVSQHN